MRKKIILILCAVFLLTAVSLTRSGAADTKINYITLSGKRLSEQEFSGGSRTILFFWTTWCPYCRTQIKYIKDRTEYIESRGGSVFMVNIGEEQGKVMDFADKMGIKHDNVILNRSSSLGRKYRILGFPTYVILRSGSEVDRLNSMTSEYLEDFLQNT